MIEILYNRIIAGDQISQKEAISLVNEQDKELLYRRANDIRKHFTGDVIDLCSIANAKSGRCTEDCKFCAQSAHYQVEIEEYELIAAKKAVEMAVDNYKFGVNKFSLVTSGESISNENLKALSVIYSEIKDKTNLELCASMGFLTSEKAEYLKQIGVRNYHCNVETARSFYKNICTTHSYDQKLDTIKIAKDAGLRICSGGIIGMGESMLQRIEMAFELRELGVLSIPLNILNPIKGTPLGDTEILTEEEVLTTFAIFRFINPKAQIRFAGGRTLIHAYQHKALNAGINAAMVGNYLTTIGSKIDEDLELFAREGFVLKSAKK